MTKKADPETALVALPVAEGGFVALADDYARELLADVKPGPRDLAKLLVPAGSGGAFFSIVKLDGEEAVKSLDIIVAYDGPTERSFYATSIDESEGGPPHCTSPSGVTGYGNRDVEAIRAAGAATDQLEQSEQACADCAFAKYGTALNGGKGQACSQRKRLVVFDRESILPMVLQIPAASLKAFKQYQMLLVNERLRSSHVVTAVSLAKQKGSPDYYTVEFKFIRKLEPGEVQALAATAKILTAAAAQD
tara:strand:- start:1835 stop:2581 length:747 start_codon:yes stop_codon:yes gene_type:complete